MEYFQHGMIDLPPANRSTLRIRCLQNIYLIFSTNVIPWCWRLDDLTHTSSSCGGACACLRSSCVCAMYLEIYLKRKTLTLLGCTSTQQTTASNILDELNYVSETPGTRSKREKTAAIDETLIEKE